MKVEGTILDIQSEGDRLYVLTTRYVYQFKDQDFLRKFNMPAGSKVVSRLRVTERGFGVVCTDCIRNERGALPHKYAEFKGNVAYVSSAEIYCSDESVRSTDDAPPRLTRDPIYSDLLEVSTAGDSHVWTHELTHVVFQSETESVDTTASSYVMKSLALVRRFDNHIYLNESERAILFLNGRNVVIVSRDGINSRIVYATKTSLYHDLHGCFYKRKGRRYVVLGHGESVSFFLIETWVEWFQRMSVLASRYLFWIAIGIYALWYLYYRYFVR